MNMATKMPELYEVPSVRWGIGLLPLGTYSWFPCPSLRLGLPLSQRKHKSFNHVQEIVELLLLQKLSEYLGLTSKFLRNDRSGKANSSWIYTALLNLQLHSPAHTQALALQQSPWPLRGCGDTWKYFDPWMIEKYLETLR